jgi:kinetochore protein Spc25
MAKFTQELDQIFIARREEVRRGPVEFTAEMAEDRNQQRNIHQAMERAKADHQEALATMQNERAEVEEVRASITEYSAKRSSLSSHREALEQQIAEVEEVLAKKRAAMSVKRQELVAQHAKNKPELQAWESQLGLQIDSAGIDMLRFTFTRVDKNDEKKPYMMVVDVRTHEYAVAECVPALPRMTALLADLNESRDFSGFLKAVRQAFKEIRQA